MYNYLNLLHLGVITLHSFIMQTAVILLPGTLSYVPVSPGEKHTEVWLNQIQREVILGPEKFQVFLSM